MSGALDALFRATSFLVSALRKLVTGLVILFFSYMAIAVLVQIAGRYVFNYSIDWTAETATFAQIWMILLAAGLAMRDKLHVSVDALTHVLSLPAQRFLTVVVALPCIWFLWQAVAGSFALIEIGRIQSSPVLQIPMWIPYLSLPVGLIYFGVEFLLSMATRWRNPAAESTST